MTLTGHRTFQYVGILLALAAIAAGYWYFAVRAGVKTNTSGSQPQGIGDLSASLSGYWKLDENTGTSAADSSTNAIASGTLTNGPTWTTGQIGSAVDFDGTNDYITVADSDYIELSATTDDLSLSGWFNRDTFTTDDTIIAKRNDITNTDAGYIVYIDDATDQLIFEISDGGAEYQLASTTTFTTTGWHHFVVVFDESSDALSNLYIDGSADNPTKSGGSISSSSNALAFRIGAESDAGNPFDGKLDEIRVYKERVFSSDEAAVLYRLTQPTDVDTGLKAYSSFNANEIRVSYALDRSGADNGYNIVGAVAAEGRVGQALNFDGVNDYGNSAADSLDNATSLSACAWIYPETLPTYGAIVSKSWEFEVVNNPDDVLTFYIPFSGTDGEWSTPSGSIVTNKWQHVCVTYNRSSTANDPVMYIDGVSVSVTEAATPTGTADSDASADLVVGAWGGAPTDFFDGSIDEPRVYNRILTASEVKSLYDRGSPDSANTSAAQPGGTGRLDSGLAGYWKFDENTGVSVADASTRGTNATLTNGPTWTTGQIGSATQFDGTNDYASASINLTTTDKVTIAFWLNITSYVDGDYAISHGDDWWTQNGFAIQPSATAGLCSAGQTQISVRGSPGGQTEKCYTRPSTGWHHWTVIYDISRPDDDEVELYLDGLYYPDAGVNSNSNTNPLSNLTLYTMSDGGASGFLAGTMDELRVYDRSLSTDEIADLYRLTTPTGVDTSLKGYWSFNGQDLSGTTAYDRSGVGNHGTLTNGPAVIEGRVGQALSFDNVNDYVLASSPAAVDDLETQGGGGMTASAWIYPESGGTFGGTIVGKRASPDTSNGDWTFSMHQDGDAIKFMKSYSTTILEAMTPSGSIALNKWQYVTATWNGGSTRSSVTFYIDGVLVPTSTTGGSDGAGTKNSDAANVVSISSQFVMFDGLIDEVRLHNRILSAAEVKSLYDAAAPDKTNTSASTSQGTGRPDSGLAGYWKLDENTGTSAGDTSTNGNTGTLTNGPTWTTGQIGTGVDFDGTNDYITIPDNNALDFADGEKFTVAGWFNRDTFTTADQIFAKQINSFDTGYGMYIDATDQIYFTVYDGTDLYSLETAAGLIAASGWHHFVAAWGDTSMVLYIDGVQTSTTPSGTIGNIGSLASTNPFRIGASSDGSQPFDGKLDEIRVYNRVLSGDEITQLYRLTSPTGTDTGLKGYWSFNGQDMTATTAYDRSGAGNNGTLTNGPTVSEGKIGQAISFDGTNDYVSVGTTFDFSTASFTLSSWVKPTSFSDFGTIIAKRDTYASNNMRYGFLLYSGTGQVTFQCGTGSTLTYGYSVPTNEWTHLAVTVTAAVTNLYVNGAFSESLAGCTTYGTDAAAETRIGSVPDGPDAFAGSLDEVRGYSRVLSASEIKTLYSSGR